MTKRQFHVLYREFLFRMVDRELLSASAGGDASKLLGRIATIVILLSLGFTVLVLGLGDPHTPHDATLRAARSAEHSLIATTMLLAGLFTVLSWDSMFPDRRDVSVLAPLPVRASTVFLAKLTSLAVALGLTVVLFNAAPGFILPLALAPSHSTILDMILSAEPYRLLLAYWSTMFAAAAFVLCSVLTIQGVAAQLPRRLFLRVTALLQVAALCLFVGVYFLQPPPASPRAFAWSPSYWFLGLFEELNGSAHNNAGQAWIGLALSIAGAGLAFLLSFFRAYRKVVEEPDIAPASSRLVSLPRFGDSLKTAIVQFSIRTLLRSRQHRIIVSFYAGMGFGILILFLKTPVAQKLSAAAADSTLQHANLPLLASSFVMMGFWALGVRVVFAMPHELRANLIFRVTTIRHAEEYLAANRRALLILALLPVWAASAAVFLWLWPWREAAGHLIVLGVVGVTIRELCLYGFRKIPFTCSYLPGKSNLHMTFCLCLLLGLNLLYWGAEFERRALAHPVKYTWMLATLGAAAVCAWWRTKANVEPGTGLHFEEEPEPAILGLGLRRDGTLPIASVK